MKALLTDWMVDPSFGKAVMKWKVQLSVSEELKSDDEVVSASRLQVLEGKAGAKELIDNDLLPKTKDKFGREAYIWSRTRVTRGRKRTLEAEQESTMELTGAQAASVRNTMIEQGLTPGGSTGSGGGRTGGRGGSRGGGRAGGRGGRGGRGGGVEETAAEKKLREARAKVAKTLGKTQKTDREAQKVLESLKTSKHPVGQTLKATIAEKQKAIQAMEKTLKAAESKEDFSKKTEALITQIDTAVDGISKDINLSRKL